MKSLRFHMAYKNLKRLRDIVTIMTKHGFRPLMERLRLFGFASLPGRLMGRKAAREKEELTAAERLRLAIEELGPTFIKFGQIISTRPDIIPHDFIIELLKLQDEVQPIAFEEIIRVIEREFKKPVGELFSSIDEKPVAAASIAQVHSAVTLAGEEVVIKVQRPGITDVIHTDLVILHHLARLMLRYVPESRLYDPAAVVDEFSMTIRRELDFTLEASYTEKFRNLFEEDPRVFIPKVFWELTGKHVLTMQRVRGIKIDRVDKLKENGIDTGKVAQLVADVFFKQVFEFGMFHGDLHSGNIFVMGEERLGLVDFGIVGRISPEMKQHLADILILFVSNEYEGLTKIYQKMGILPEGIDKTLFEREYYDIMLHYFGRPLKTVKIGEFLLDYIQLAARHNVRLPKDLLLFDKCLLELEGLARQLYPEVNIISECEPYAARLYKARLAPGNVLKETVETVKDYKDLIEELPERADKIISKVLEDRLRIEFMHKGLEDFIGEMDRSSNRLTFGVIVAALIIGSSMVIQSEAMPTIRGYPALGVAGFLIASFLGLWLAVQILRSRKF